MFENFRCSTAKKKVAVTRKRPRKRIMIPRPHTRGNASSLLALQRKPALDKKVAVKSRIQEILSGRSRFVIRKVAPAKGGAGAAAGGQEGGGDPSFVSRREEEVKRDRYTCPPSNIPLPDAIWLRSHLLAPSSHTNKEETACFHFPFLSRPAGPTRPPRRRRGGRRRRVGKAAKTPRRRTKKTTAGKKSRAQRGKTRGRRDGKEKEEEKNPTGTSARRTERR